jgi:hypothetical protein
VLITNLKLTEYLRETGQDEEFNSAVEEGSGWGNVAWKKVGKTYERVDLKNFYVINQTARALKDSPVIERHQFISSDMRAMAGKWDNVAEALKGSKTDSYKSETQTIGKKTTVPYYEVYERNGEVCLADLKRVHGKTATEEDEEKYVFAKVTAVGKSTPSGVKIDFILFAQEMKGKDNSDIYREFHRGPYKGRWFREGLYELLMDCQVRLNQIGNQIAVGLEFASKIVFESADKLLIQNILTDMKNGDVIKTTGLKQVPIIMEGFTQLIADWNTVQQTMNDIANSSPIVTGEGMPQRMSFQQSALLNQNANKLFDFIRQKLAVPFTHIFQEWIIPEHIAELSAKEILRLTGDAAMLDRLYGIIVDDWYVGNMLAIGPHGPEVADFLKNQQLDMLKKHPNLLMKGLKQVFKDFKPSVSVVITGENSTLPQDMQTLSQFINLEQDPVRRSAMIEMAMSKKGIDVASLPKTPPGALSPMQPDATGKVAIDGNTHLPARPAPPVRGKAA